jgi:hypothetical protein
LHVAPPPTSSAGHYGHFDPACKHETQRNQLITTFVVLPAGLTAVRLCFCRLQMLQDLQTAIGSETSRFRPESRSRFSMKQELAGQN